MSAVHSGINSEKPAWAPPKEYPIGVIMRRWGQSYIEQYHPPIHVIRAIYDIGRCRTGWFGGRLIRCLDCGHERQFWHSCGNRNCPVCQSIQKEIWIDRRTAQLLPVRHFHMVFTLPHELNELIAFNKSLLLGALFKAA